MLRSLTQRRGRGRVYERVTDEAPDDFFEAKLYRTKSLPVKMFGSIRKKVLIPENESAAKVAKNAGKIHPLFGLFDRKSWKKTTSDPVFSRYLEYLKQGG